MINLPIAEITTPTGKAAMAVEPWVQTDTPASGEFQAVMAEIPVPMLGQQPDVDVADTDSGVMAVFAAQVLNWQIEMPKPQAPSSILVNPKLDTAGELLESNSRSAQDSEAETKGLSSVVVAEGDRSDQTGPVPEKQVKSPIYSPKLTEIEPLKKSGKRTISRTISADIIPAQDFATENSEILSVKTGETVQKSAQEITDQKTQAPKSDVSALTRDFIMPLPLKKSDTDALPAIIKQTLGKGETDVPDLRVSREKQSAFDRTRAYQPPAKGLNGSSGQAQPKIISDPSAMPKMEIPLLQDNQRDATTPNQPEKLLQDIGTSPEVPKPLPKRELPDHPDLTANPAKTRPVATVAPTRKLTKTTTRPVLSPDTEISATKRIEKPQLEPMSAGMLREAPAAKTEPAPQPAKVIPLDIMATRTSTKDSVSPELRDAFEFSGVPTAHSHHTGLTLSHHGSVSTQPDIPRHVARQLANVARHMPERPVELTLHPDDLGRVRLTFTLKDGGINVAVLAERGETMDLMRRHIETLAQEFHDMGYADVGFQFSQHSQEDAKGNNNAHAPQSPILVALPEIESRTPAKLSLEPSTGLDLRL